ncbi:SlyX family protein [Cellvibrio mixtus]|uniref:SlyX family protein n=1 Tax=Cellvibrio mixtus TaxID=39650 RepID=UPI0005879679|nr:SlyX family protein [Cellvibrio mixtus]
MTDFQEQLIDLQTRVAYQEDTLEQLNQVITQQDADITQLKQQIRILAQRLEDSLRTQGQGGEQIQDERPPHY